MNPRSTPQPHIVELTAPTHGIRLQADNFRARFWTCLAGLLILLHTFGVGSLAQGDSCETGVNVRFQGRLLSDLDYTLEIYDAATGRYITDVTGDGNGCSSYINTEKGRTKLVVNRAYKFSVDADNGRGGCDTHVNFEVPEGYVLYVNGVERTTIDGYDGVWEIVVKQKCACDGGGGAPGDAYAKLDSVNWGVSLGKLSDGRSAESIGIREDALSAAVYTPAALIYSPPGLTNDVDVVRSTDGSLRQVRVPETFADIVTVSSSEYDIRFYRPAEVGAKVNGLYTLSGQPFVTYKVKNPDPASTARLQILKIENGATVDTTEYTWDAAIDSWSLSTGGGARNETLTVSYPTPKSRTEIFIVRDGTGQIAAKTAKTYYSFAWGEELIQQVTDPDDAALTTTYTYYEDASEEAHYSKIESVTNADGSWERYDYDTNGNKSLVMRPWKDLALASATEDNSYVTRYYYTNTDGIETSQFARHLERMEEYIAGVLVRKITHARTSTPVGGAPAVTETETVYSSAAASQQTTTVTYYHTNTPLHLANRTAYVSHPDGRRDTFTYEKGNYATNVDPGLNTFTTDANGRAERTTIVHGTAAAPDGVAFKTMKETTVRDERGREVSGESYVYTGVGYERVAWTVMSYDERGHLVETRRHTGQVSGAVWNGDEKISETDETGVETAYTYDALDRVKTRTKKGVAASGAYAAQADITTTYNYDAEGRQTGETTTAGGLSPGRTSVYDAAGRIRRETDEAGLATIYAYADGGRKATMTRPGGATQVTEGYLDGQTKSVMGTGVVAQSFDYGVNADGTRYTGAYVGANGLNSPRWTKTTSDWMGRTVKVETPTFTGATLVKISTYNGKGQMQAESVTAGGIKLVADIIHEYDELGNGVRAGIDLDAGGTLTAASTDRFTETETRYEKTGGDWFRVSTSKSYLTDNSDTATVQIQRERLTGFTVSGTEKAVAEAVVTNIAGNSTRSITTVDRAAKRTTTTTDTPESNVDAVSVAVNGLLQSSTTTTPQTATTYIYDALGRMTGTIDARTGTATKSYNATTGQLITESDGVQSTGYEYYPATHTSAGRLKSRTNAAGKKTYFDYSSRGEMVRTWGETTYPMEYVYDGYGQRAEMRTYRGGAGWTTGSWTAATGAADVTRWEYEAASGVVERKVDAAGKAVAYSYDALGRAKTRTWARGTATNYAYTPQTGELSGVDYADQTPDVTFSYDRGGRQAGIVDAAGERTLTHTAAGEVKTDRVQGGVLDGVQTSVAYDAFLRRDFLQAARGATVLMSQTYGYDSSSRLQTITSNNQTATYAYHPTGLLNTTSYAGGMSVARSYDNVGRLTSITTSTSTGTLSGYGYTYNNLHQRTRVTREDGSYWLYSYNDRGEVVSGKRYWADNTLVWGQQGEYAYDNIGNRSATRAGGNHLNQLRQSTYATNSLNQYTGRTNPGAVDVTGTAQAQATVTVNNEATVRKSDYFYKELAVDNSAAPVSAQVNVVGARQNFGAGGEDAVTERGGRVLLPRAQESYSYDSDGNLSADGLWTYRWDGENRLVSMESLTSVAVEARQKLEFAYDYMGRRIEKRVFGFNVGTGAYQLQSTMKFVYDGWNLVAELDANFALVRSYVWGQDVSGTLQGAGGVGGLLTINDGGQSYQAGYDGNGNLTTLVKAGANSVAASYEYDAFGNTLKGVGEYAERNPVRFSTKYADAETGLLYYGYRYYQPQTGRWLSRDPLEEAGGVNLYEFVVNDSLNRIDRLGLQPITFDFVAFISNHHDEDGDGWMWEPAPNPDPTGLTNDWFPSNRLQFNTNKRGFGEFDRRSRNGKLFSFGQIESTKLGQDGAVSGTGSDTGPSIRRSRHIVRTGTNTAGWSDWVTEEPRFAPASNPAPKIKSFKWACSTMVTFEPGASYPFVRGSPRINYKVTFWFRRIRRNKVRVQISGWHNAFPDYEAYILGSMKYKHQSSYSGPTMRSLTNWTNMKTVEFDIENIETQ